MVSPPFPKCTLVSGHQITCETILCPAAGSINNGADRMLRNFAYYVQERGLLQHILIITMHERHALCASACLRACARARARAAFLT